MTYEVAFLHVWADRVREVVRRSAPREFELSFASSYDAAPRLRMVRKWGIGIDAIDQAALRRRGIALGIAPGCNAGPVAELTIALALAVYRRIPYVNRSLREGCRPARLGADRPEGGLRRHRGRRTVLRLRRAVHRSRALRDPRACGGADRHHRAACRHHPLVRLPSHEAQVANCMLDAGALGVIAPHVESAEQARAVVAARKFAPEGTRS